jgi:hypothetical protein
MTATTNPATQLDRAHIQGKVIESNLEHLRIGLLGTDSDMGDQLVPIARAFEQYVRRLRTASTRADAAAVASMGPASGDRGAV